MAKTTTATIALPADMVLETTIGARGPDGRTFQATLGDFPPAAIEKFLRYGFQRVFNDKVGGSDTTTTDKVAAAEVMIERFKAGDIGRAVATGVDAVTRLARVKARAAFKATYKNAPEWTRFNDLDKAKQGEVLDQIIEKNPHFREEAEMEIAARAKATTAVDLGDIL